MTLLRAIEMYIQRNHTSESRLGRRALRDPSLVRDLRNGRELRPPTMRRLRSFLETEGV